jgi:hypothetical protein
MNSKKIFLFVILILSIIIPCFLGSCYYEGFTDSSDSINFYNNIDGIEVIVSVTKIPTGISVSMDSVHFPVNIEPVNLIPSSTDSNTYRDPDGKTATITTDSNGINILTLSDPNYPENDLVFKEKPNANTNLNTNTNANANTYTNNIFSGFFDNYNHFTGTSYPSIFYAPLGFDVIARVIQTGNETSIVFTYSDGTQKIFTSKPNSPPNTFYNLEYEAIIKKNNYGKYEIEVLTTNENTASYGSSIIFTQDNPTLTPIQDKGGYNVTSFTELNDIHSNATPTASTNTIKGSSLNNNVITNGTNSNYINNSGNYNNSLPNGIPASQIPTGQEDLYILKSQVVPPVCPACPEPIVQCPTNIDLDQCPPCPACARCQEPSFDCKKVPNYNAFNPQDMPVPVLNDFSSFGM